MVGIFAHLFGESGGMRPTENQLCPKPFFNFLGKPAVGLDGACSAVHDQIIRAEIRDFFHKRIVVPFFKAPIKKFNFVVGVPFENRRTISQLPRVICKNAVVSCTVGPTAGRVDHGITLGVNSNGVTNGYFHRFPLLSVRYFCYRLNNVDGLLQALFPEPEKGSPRGKSLKLIAVEIN